jgi:hypothetical protein
VHERVFDEPLIPRTTFLTATESPVNWFLHSTLPEAIEGRRIINDLYSRFPDKSGHMWERLRGDNEKDRLSALDELLVHDELAGSYRVEYEEGDGTRPEFLLYKHQDGAYVGTVEVVTLFLRKDWEAVERRNAVLQDALNARLRLTTHWIDFEVRRWDSNSPPKTGHMVKWIEDALSELRTDPSALPVDRLGRQEKVYSTRTVDIAFRFLPLSPTYVVDENARVVLGGAPISGFINSGTRLRERLDDKARKYDLHGKPFAVVVGVRDPVCDIGQVYEALVGTEEIVVPTLESRHTADDFTHVESRRKGDGFFGIWGHRGEGKHQQVSAVFSVHEWYPGGPYRPRITRFDNPMAAAPFPEDGLSYSGRWGMTERDATHVHAAWLIPPVAPIPAREP